MAFVSNYQPEEEKQTTAQGPVVPGGATQTTPVSAPSGVGNAGAPATGAAPKAGGEFATLNQYVNANQGQAAPLANQITSGIGNQYNTLQGQNQQTLQGIQGQVDKGYTKQNQDILAQESSNPVSFASNPSNIQSFQGQLNDKYTGPQSAESTGAYSGQLANVNNAIAQGQAKVGTDAGRQQLLKQYEQSPTAGVTGLNSAILAQDPNAQANIEKAYQPFSNLVTGLQSGAQGINNQIGQAQTEAQKAAEAANKQITGQITGLNTQVQNTASQNETQRLANNQNILNTQSAFQQPNTFLNGTNAYLTQNGGTAINNPFSQYVNANPFNTPATAANVATPEQYSQAGAFQNLINGVNLGLPSPVLDQNQANQAGTYQAPNMLPTPNNKALADQVWQQYISNYGQMASPFMNNRQPVPQSNDANNLYQSLLQFDPNLVV